MPIHQASRVFTIYCELHVGLGVIMKVLRRRGGGERRGQMEELQALNPQSLRIQSLQDESSGTKTSSQKDASHFMSPDSGPVTLGFYECDILVRPDGSNSRRCWLHVTGTFVVNVTQTSYQAEENQNITLEWTFSTRTDTSLRSISTHCFLHTNDRTSVLFNLNEGVESTESQDPQFTGRVQWDKDVLTEGRLTLHVSRLRTKDSGSYECEIHVTPDGTNSRDAGSTSLGNVFDTELFGVFTAATHWNKPETPNARRNKPETPNTGRNKPETPNKKKQT
ncbi:hypothetical protein F7725_004920 [Dissostichus mawsoni]|uniref:Immunoglobulin V-set domain-containing protein n=1 Tax=Dissostichus mawsoni TaxID=36200 RepID=A0A7J5XK45_DISMA|nr:hypothetical protein F7725_004920 [Dissostichus mawsoni]